MNETPRKRTRSRAVDILAICVLLLLPGIEGYGNWPPYWYIFIVAPIALIIYQWVKGK